MEKETIITSLSSFVEMVNATHIVKQPTGFDDIESDNVFYRGQSNKEWKLQPGLFRTDGSDCIPQVDSLYRVEESSLLKTMERELYTELQSCRTSLDKLMFLQHYGLRTRLLDVSYNPLVALYFACCEDFDCDGCVYYGRDIAESYDMANEIADCAFSDVFSFVHFQSKVECSEKRERLLSKVYFVRGKHSFSRVAVQNGGFLIAPILKREGEDLYTVTDYDMRDAFRPEVFVVKSDSKRSILKELSYCGIEEGTLFPDLEHKIRGIYNRLMVGNKCVIRL